MAAGRGATVLSTIKVQTTVRNPPNSLLILGDEIACSDLGCSGGEIRTPNLK
jgi:hypothetical protein